MKDSKEKAYWSLAPAEVLATFKSTPAGLSQTEATSRLLIEGPNRLSSEHRGPLVDAVLSQLRNPLLWLLLFAAIVGIAVGEVTDSAIILVILLLGSLISIVQESSAGRALDSLRKVVALQTSVIRDGVESQVPATSVVPGDVLVLSAGVMIAADAVLLEARDLYVGQAALTGESLPAEKSVGAVDVQAGLATRTNVVHMGTSVRSGTGRALVVQTGANTAFGKVAGRLALRPPETEFQRGLRRFGYLLVSLMMVLMVVVFLASAIRHHPPIDALLFAVALAVGLAPEMLPAVLATMLARGARRMSEKGVLVRRLEATENLGNMNVLCTDKTGTLTEGEMTVDAATDSLGQASDDVLKLAFWNARLQQGLANPLDRALILRGEEHGFPLPTRLDEIPFDFERKRLSVVVKLSDEARLLVTKGASIAVLSVCEFLRQADGAIVPMDETLRAGLDQRLAEWSAEGVRVIGIATRKLAADELTRRDSEHDLIFEGFAAFRDPPKLGVVESLARLKELGIHVKVISGDHHGVVEHLAASIGMDRQIAARGPDLARLSDEALWNVVDRFDLFAEVDPNQKERIVVALKKVGHVVGFMGDGINDAPAIRSADVGISVAGATDVAREAADFVLLKSDLGVISDGVQEGRIAFANTLKYVLTTESANLGNMLSMAVASLFLPFLPLLAHQVLLNNLLSDVPSATLANDSVDPETVLQPQRWDVGYIRRFMMSFGVLSAVFDILTFLVFTQFFLAGPEEFRTAWFTESLLTELFVLLVLRTRRQAWKSRPHPLLLGSTVLVAIIAFILPLSPVAEMLGFVDISPAMWMSVIVISVVYVLTVEFVKRPLLARLLRATHEPKPRPHRVWPWSS